MEKQVKIISCAFKYNNDINYLSIEEYIGYDMLCGKIKFLYKGEYFEKDITFIDANEDCLTFDDVIIKHNHIEGVIGKYVIKWDLDCSELINEFNKKVYIKNYYKMFLTNHLLGFINEEIIESRIYFDFEVLRVIPDEYYKIYAIDFADFSGSFSMLAYDKKVSSINLKYKDLEFNNKKSLSFRNVKFFKFSTLKLKASGNCFWQVNIKTSKIYKGRNGVIPFKYQRGQLYIRMKKHLFRNDLRASSKEILFISYRYV